jgi:hypothetical protein
MSVCWARARADPAASCTTAFSLGFAALVRRKGSSTTSGDDNSPGQMASPYHQADQKTTLSMAHPPRSHQALQAVP